MSKRIDTGNPTGVVERCRHWSKTWKTKKKKTSGGLWGLRISNGKREPGHKRKRRVRGKN